MGGGAAEGSSAVGDGGQAAVTLSLMSMERISASFKVLNLTVHTQGLTVQLSHDSEAFHRTLRWPVALSLPSSGGEGFSYGSFYFPPSHITQSCAQVSVLPRSKPNVCQKDALSYRRELIQPIPHLFSEWSVASQRSPLNAKTLVSQLLSQQSWHYLKMQPQEHEQPFPRVNL